MEKRNFKLVNGSFAFSRECYILQGFAQCEKVHLSVGGRRRVTVASLTKANFTKKRLLVYVIFWPLC